MNRRSFIKGLMALASAPAIGKYVNVFKTEGAREGIEQVASKGVDFFNSVIKKVMDEGTLVNESDTIKTFTHPERSDIMVDVNMGDGTTSVYFDTEEIVDGRSKKEIVLDGLRRAREGKGNYSDPNATGSAVSARGNIIRGLEDAGEIEKGPNPNYDPDTKYQGYKRFIKKKYATGGRVGFRSGGIFKGLKGIQFGRIQKDLTKKYKDEGMEFMEALQKGSDEGLEIINKKKLNFLSDKMNEVDIYSDEYVKLIDEHIKIVEPDFYKDIKRWEGTRSDLADKTRASFFPDWAEARYGEDYMGVLQKKQAKAINESIDPNFKEPLSPSDQMASDIDDMNKANIDDYFGTRKKNAAGGRVGFKSGKLVKDGIAALARLAKGKKKQMTDEEITDFADEFGIDPTEEYYNFDGTLESANQIVKDQKAYEAEMYDQYKLGKLDPKPGESGRKKFLEKRAEEAEMSGDPKLFTLDEADELTSMQKYGGPKSDAYYMQRSEIANSINVDDLPVELLTPEALKVKFPGMPDEMAKMIGTDKNLQRKAEAIATVEQAFLLKDSGKSIDEIIATFNAEPKSKMADGGPVTKDVSLTVIKIPDISQSGVESLFKRR